jgi:hypothetical protein
MIKTLSALRVFQHILIAADSQDAVIPQTDSRAEGQGSRVEPLKAAAENREPWPFPFSPPS